MFDDIYESNIQVPYNKCKSNQWSDVYVNIKCFNGENFAENFTENFHENVVKFSRPTGCGNEKDQTTENAISLKRRKSCKWKFPRLLRT